MTEILVTGGAGFIGSNLVDKLLELNFKVIALDNFDDFYDSRIKKNNLFNALKNKNFTLVEGDIRDKNVLTDIFKSHNIETVIHLAAKAGVRPSLLNPEVYYDVNVTGTLRLLEVMKQFDVNKLIFASSSSVYGNNTKVPFSETDNVDYPISPYAASKKAGELICYCFHHLYKMDIFCLRFFTVYGQRQRPEMGIHLFSNNIVKGIPIKMYGDGTSKRDYTYIGDIVHGIINSINKVKGYEIINLGESQTISLKELIILLEKIIGKKAIIENYPQQEGDVDKTFADVTKAKKIIEYNPGVNIENGLKNFITWFNQNHFK